MKTCKHILLALVILTSACAKDPLTISNIPGINDVVVDEVRRTSAKLTASLKDDSWDVVTECGFKLSDNVGMSEPQIIVSEYDVEAGSFSSKLAGLEIGKTYYYSAYISNGISMISTPIGSFSTLAYGEATIINMTAEGKTFSAEIADNGGKSIVSAGFCYDTKPNPDISSMTFRASAIDDERFEAFFPEITENIYYIRAFTESNDEGHTSYSYSQEDFVFEVRDDDRIRVKDSSFEHYLIYMYDTNKDGKISIKEASEIKEIVVNTNNISTLEGIEYFATIERLVCSGSADKQNPGLEELDLSHNTMLKELDCSYNKLKALDVSVCKNLVSLNCSGNMLEELNLVDNPVIENLNCSGNNISSLDVTHLTLNSLDARGNQDLKVIIVNLSFDMENTDNYKKDDDCEFQYNKNSIVPFEDQTFKKFCVSRFDLDKDGEISLIEADMVTEMAVPAESIRTLGGIEFFKNLAKLECHPSYTQRITLSDDLDYYLHNGDNKAIYGGLSSLDLSKNPKLRELSCEGNALTSLDLSKNPDLIYLNTGYNKQLSYLSISENTKLERLLVGSTKVAGINISHLKNLKELECFGCGLSELNLRSNVNLSSLNATGNPLLKTILVADDFDSSSTNMKIDPDAVFDKVNPDIDFEDPAFKSFCIQTFDLNKDQKLSKEEIASVTSIDVRTDNISSLRGIEAFYNLESLSCHPEYTTTPTRLGGIKDLDLSVNTKLTHLSCEGNQIQRLDLSANTALKNINVSFNKDLVSLEMASCKDVEVLSIGSTKLNGIDFSNYPKIKTLDASGLGLTSLNLSSNRELSSLDCSYNELIYIFLKENTSVLYLDARNNPYLSYILVADSFDESKGTFLIDSHTSFFQGDHNVNFEDSEFKNHCIANYDTDNDGEISIWEAAAVTSIEVNTKNIFSLRGVEYFSNLERLYCTSISGGVSTSDPLEEYGQLTQLNLLHNGSLRYLDCSGNRLLKLDLSNNTVLAELNASHNPSLETVVINSPDFLYWIFLYSTAIKEIQLSGNTTLSEYSLLEYLDLTATKVANIDVSNCQSLSRLSCAYCPELNSIQIDNTPNLESVDCYNSGLSSLNLTGCPNLQHLNCTNCHLEDLDIRLAPKLRILYCDANNLQSIYVDGNYELEEINCAYNRINDLDFSSCPQLKSIMANENPLYSLNIDNCHNLEVLFFSCELIGSLDISRYPLLITLDIQCPIKVLDTSNNPLLRVIQIEQTQVSSLDVSNNPLLRILRSPSVLKDLWIRADQNIESLKIGEDTIIHYVD